jgi:hypothetical protein
VFTAAARQLVELDLHLVVVVGMPDDLAADSFARLRQDCFAGHRGDLGQADRVRGVGGSVAGGCLLPLDGDLDVDAEYAGQDRGRDFFA